MDTDNLLWSFDLSTLLANNTQLESPHIRFPPPNGRRVSLYASWQRDFSIGVMAKMIQKQFGNLRRDLSLRSQVAITSSQQVLAMVESNTAQAGTIKG